MREAIEYTAGGLSALITVPVVHTSKSDDSDLDDSNPSLGDLIAAGSFVFLLHQLALLLPICLR